MKPQTIIKQRKPTAKQTLGRHGEDLACEYLLKHGYRIIDRNFKKRYGELDVICIKDNILIFVEVKTRVGHAFGTPEEAVTPWKLREVKQTSLYYKMINPQLPEALRIDVIGIELDYDKSLTYFNHIQNVTL